MRTHTALFLTLCGLCLIWGCSDDDNPVDPGNGVDTTTPPPDHYEVFGLESDFFGSQLHLMETELDTPLASLELSSGCSGLYRTPDGRLLVSQYPAETTLVVIHPDSGLDYVLPFSGDYYFDQSAGLAMVVYAEGFRLVHPTSLGGGLAYAAHTRAAVLDTAAHLLYGLNPLDPLYNVIHRYDYVALEPHDSLIITDTLGQAIEIGAMLPVSNHQRLFLYGRLQGQLYSFVYDLASHRVLSSTAHDSPVGKFLLSHDGNRVFQSDPSDQSGYGRIWYRSAQTGIIQGFLSTEVTLPDSSQVTVWVSDLEITPDDKYLYAVGGAPGALLVYDLTRFKLVSVTTPFLLGGFPSIVIGDSIPGDSL